MIFLEMFVAFAATMAFAVIFNDCRDGIVANFGERKTYARYGLFDFGNNIACTRCGYV